VKRRSHSHAPGVMFAARNSCGRYSWTTGNHASRWSLRGEILPRLQIGPTFTWPEVALYRPILQLGYPSDEGSQHPKDRLQFFFSFELSYLKMPMKPRLGGLPKINDRLTQKPLATRTFIVQNSLARSSITRRATALDRADFGRLSRDMGS
jgi:hypothetical protein